MNIVVINGTEVKGCTYAIKELFLKNLKNENTIKEFYLPRDFPVFCSGCKICFLKSELLCPNSKYLEPIWSAVLESDLILFVYPVYVMRAPAQIKALLDHLACHWMVHRPNPTMFNKRAVIITQSIGAPNKFAQKDVSTSLSWLGVSDIKKIGFGLMEGIIWNDLSIKRRNKIENKINTFSKKYQNPKFINESIKIKFLFWISKQLHKNILSKEKIVSIDNQYWIDNGWIKK